MKELNRVILAFAVIAVLSALVALFVRLVLKVNQEDKAKLWPSAEATIQSAAH